MKIEIDPGHGQLRGDARLQLTSLGSGAEEVSLELNHELVVLSVTDGTDRSLDYDRNGGNLTVRHRNRSSETESQIVRIRYRGSFSERVPELNFFNAWIGPDISYALHPGRWYPQMPEPARRSKGKIAYFVPENWTVASVGKMTAEKILPSGKQYDFDIASSVAYSFAAAPFRSLRRNIEGLDVGVFLLGGSQEKAEYYLENCAPELLLIHSARSYFQALQSPAASDRALLGLLLRGEDLELGIPSVKKFNTLHMLANSKGCIVFVMLRDLIGGEAFQAGLRGALARFARKTMTLADLRVEFEKAAARDLEWFFDQWFFRKGAPEFILSCAAEAQGADWVVKGRIRQVRDVYWVTAELAFVKDGSRETRAVEIRAEETGFSFVLPFKPDEVLFDPDYKILRWTDEFKF